jgi:hypothetical protein
LKLLESIYNDLTVEILTTSRLFGEAPSEGIACGSVFHLIRIPWLSKPTGGEKGRGLMSFLSGAF